VNEAEVRLIVREEIARERERPIAELLLDENQQPYGFRLLSTGEEIELIPPVSRAAKRGIHLGKET
jgi:hypothetical protein